ncbi:MAG: NTP transferase domain-containing protein [Hyphomicrobiaceae bacterium]
MHSLLTIILAAGKGTRMKSAIPKVLHPIAGLPMLGHVLLASEAAGTGALAVVVGPEMENVAAHAREVVQRASVFIQTEQLGTANAVLAARDALAAHNGDVLVTYGDTPLLRPETLKALQLALEEGADVAVLGFEAADPTGYGRLLMDGPDLLAIREEREATPEERQIRLCNSGVMAFRSPDIVGVLDRIGNANRKGEFYLTDAIEVIRKDGLQARVVTCPESEVMGVNSRDQLAQAEAVWQTRRRLTAMRDGASLIAPETVWFSHDTVVGKDVTIEPNVFIGPGVIIEDNVVIKANTHLQGIDEKSRGGIRIRSGA